jgi:hypothetical protein
MALAVADVAAVAVAATEVTAGTMSRRAWMPQKSSTRSSQMA